MKLLKSRKTLALETIIIFELVSRNPIQTLFYIGVFYGRKIHDRSTLTTVQKGPQTLKCEFKYHTKEKKKYILYICLDNNNSNKNQHQENLNQERLAAY